MTPIAVDTNAYSALRHGDPEIAEVFWRADRLLICCVVLGELIARFEMGSRNAANRQSLAEFLALSRVTLLPVTLATAEVYGRVLAGLHARAARSPPTISGLSPAHSSTAPRC